MGDKIRGRMSLAIYYNMIFRMIFRLPPHVTRRLTTNVAVREKLAREYNEA